MRWQPSWGRSLVWRFLVPVAIAVTLVAVLGVPHLDRTLADWFRADVQLRARLVMNSIEAPLVGLLRTEDRNPVEAYLNQLGGRLAAASSEVVRVQHLHAISDGRGEVREHARFRGKRQQLGLLFPRPEKGLVDRVAPVTDCRQRDYG